MNGPGYADLDERMAAAKTLAGQGMTITQNPIGGYMYLRSLMGPLGVLYAVHDAPDLVRARWPML
jgi:hypothetical protein